MYSKVEGFLLYAISPLHVGSGSKIGVVDLPIQRETHTNFPKIESSSLKGAIRSSVHETISQRDESAELVKQWEDVFGTELKEGAEGSKSREESTVAGAIAFADARVLLFPVRSMRGVFAYVTCPMVIQRFNQERGLYQMGKTYPELKVPEANTVTEHEEVSLDSQSKEKKIVLEEYTFQVKSSDATNQLATQLQEMLQSVTSKNSLAKRLVVLSDDDFTDFITLSTEINARIKINSETGTVDSEVGALWYEENVPPETVFYSFLFAGKPRKKGRSKLETAEEVVAFLKNESYFPSVCQIGGNYTLGRGMMKRIWLKGGAADGNS